MKLPRTIRLDPSDGRVFHNAAEPGEWAVTGTFSFVDAIVEDMDNKSQLAFTSGWMGVGSFGYSTFVQVSIAPDNDVDGAIRALATHLFQAYGAPDMLAAMDAAEGEIKHAESLCDHPAGTLLAIKRDLTDDGISEQIRVIPRDDEEGGHARIWEFVEEDE